MDAAKPIPPHDRSEFLRDVAVELAQYPELGLGIVGRVVREAKNRYFDPPQFHSGCGKYNR
jgi:hypothetical protein